MRRTVVEPLTDILLMDTMMDQFARGRRKRHLKPHREQSLDMPMDVIEDADGYTVKAIIPGINPEDLHVSISDQVLTIRGELKGQELGEGAQYQLCECPAGHYGRSLRFPALVQGEAIEAHYDHGILTVRLPKAEVVKPRRITVQVQGA